MHARLAETMTYVEEKRTELLQSFQDVSSDRLCRRATPDGWSVAEILDHLRIVESGIARIITKRVAQAKEAGIGEETSTESVMSSFERHSTALETMVLKSPETVKPRPNIGINEALDGLRSSRDALRAAAVFASGVPLGEIKHTHVILGELDLYQWLIFLGQHESRHRRQIERTLKSIPE